MSRARSRRLLAAIASCTALTTAVLISGCSSSGTADSSSSSSSSRGSFVSMVTPESTGEYYGAMYCGAKAAAAKAGIKLKIQGTPETTVDAEMQVVQSVLATNPGGLLLTVWDNEAFNQTLASYTDAGKPLIMPDSFLSNDKFLQSVRTDSYQSSYDAAVQALKDFHIDSGKVLIVTDSPGNALQSDRAKGFKDAVEKNSRLKVLKYQYVGGDAAKAAQAVTAATSANSDLKLVFSTNIGAGTGVAGGLTSAGAHDVVHIGYDTSKAQVEALRSGAYDALIGQSPYQMGYQSMELMGQILNGEKKADSVGEKTVHTPWKLITADNVKDADSAKFLYNADCSAN
ncbi:substrate-binding domain-containing protein [Streptomyces shenzhenensis]|uniref:substrate-binding domain-containing protein n=1 Tax=Streptomyces shenzhenensis TaxID=943815 RepID=UPI0033FE937C